MSEETTSVGEILNMLALSEEMVKY